MRPRVEPPGRIGGEYMPGGAGGASGGAGWEGMIGPWQMRREGTLSPTLSQGAREREQENRLREAHAILRAAGVPFVEEGEDILSVDEAVASEVGGGVIGVPEIEK